MIAILDYKIGNVKSICNMLTKLGFESIIADVKLLGIENYILDIDAMLRIKNLLQNIRNVREILKAPLQHGYLILQDELLKFHDLNFILDRLYKIIDREGKIHDHASPALLSIRQQLKSKQNEIYKISYTGYCFWNCISGTTRVG